MANETLSKANKEKNDEFYTQYEDIEREINAYTEYNPDLFRNKTILLPCDDPEWSNFTRFFVQNFEQFGLKKLISTSYAVESKKVKTNYHLSLSETEKPQFNADRTDTQGKIFTLTRDNNSGDVSIDDLKWQYLDGDGDFRSAEIKALRDEADFIITNPPFSLFREFLAWITEAKKKFVIIGNMNAITYREVFPLIKENKMWLGRGFGGGNAYFRSLSKDVSAYAGRVYNAETGLVKFRNCCWFTNIEHGRRHQPLSLMTMEDNIKFSRHRKVCDKKYLKYDNYDAIEVPYTDAIPSDYDGVMGVPISFLNKYCPEQFEIVGLATGFAEKGKDALRIKKYVNAIQHNPNGTTEGGNKVNDGPTILFDSVEALYERVPAAKPYYTAEQVQGFLAICYARILIRRKAALHSQCRHFPSINQ